MRAAGEAADAPFLLVIDALNEAAEARGWQAELPVLLAETSEDPWIAVAVSVRTTFLPIVMPGGGLSDAVAQVEHPGFQGREVEATELFFDIFGLEAPRIPLLNPEFTNPLFLKLYCEGLQASRIQDPGAGSAHIGDVFDRYLAWKAERIYDRLPVDPTTDPVAASITAFADALGEADRERMPYEEGRRLIGSFAPGLNEWPNTLFGQLLAEGVLAKDAAWDSDSNDYIDVVRFSYQRFADHRVVLALLANFSDAAVLTASIAASEPLRQRLESAPAGWIEALAQQVPERFGVELFDAANWTLDEYGIQVWDRALARSIAARRPEAVSDRTLELLSRANERNWGETNYVLDAALAVAPIPGHPLNAQWLHERLLAIAMPDRDVAWSIPTYFMLDERGPLDRLIRWAARGPGARTPEAVVELTALALAWTLTSPNRRLRDYTTKTLVTLLRGRLVLAARLIAAFRTVDDPYIIERLAVITHGVLLTTENGDPSLAAALARTLRDIALGHTPNIVTRDAARGALECCLHIGQISAEEYESVLPPYASSPPDESRSKVELEQAYDRDLRDPETGDRMPSPYGMLFVSLFDLGDFGRYVVQSKLRHFTRYPLSDPVPEPEPPEPESPPNPNELAALLTAFEELVQDAPSAPSASLNPDRSGPPDPDSAEPVRQRRTPQTDAYPTVQAQCWIFERVIELGWTPERFSDFEQTYVRSAGRSSHKPERFGKKYQWIALRELLARIADNFHPALDYGGDSRPYAGPWQFFGRDIDPTLPPAQRTRDDQDEFRLGATFPDQPAWWSPPNPSYGPDDPPPTSGWAIDPHGIPEFKQLVRYRDDEGHSWLTLCAFYRWGDEYSDDDGRDADRRDLWSHLFGWLVKPADFKEVCDYLSSHSLMGRWMPEGPTVTDAAYLGEMPWASATRDSNAEEWPEIWHRGEDGAAGLDRKVSPAWIDYFWEGNVWDCSIEDGVPASLPAPLLFTAGELTWHPQTRSWVDAAQTVVAQTARAGAHSALLVREDWITRVLNELNLRLVIGWLGEKQLLARGWTSGLVGDWLEIDGTAWLTGSGITFGQRRLTRREQGR